MKKHLMASTSLVAAGLLASMGPAEAQMKGASLSLGGYTVASVSYANNDNSAAFSGFEGNGRVSGDDVNFDVKADGEIWFTGNLALDNGVRIFTRVELEQETQADQIDEAYVRFRGAFGQLKLGGDDSVAEEMTTGYNGAWAVNVGRGIDFDIDNYIAQPMGFARVVNSRGGAVAGDATKVSYITPRFAGFQAGVSYTPYSADDFSGATIPGGTTATRQNRLHSKRNAAYSGISVAANFDRKFGDFRVAVAGSYEQFQKTKGTTGDDPEQWNIGSLFEYGPVRLSVSYDDLNSTAGGRAGASVIWQAGGRYSFGANAVSLAYMNQDNTGAPGGGHDKADIVIAGFSHNLAPGTKWHATFWYTDYKNESKIAGFAQDTTAWAMDTGITIRF